MCNHDRGSFTLVTDALLEHRDGFNLIEVVERLELRTLAEEDPALYEPWQPGAQLIRCMAGSGNGEDIVEFFEGPLFCFCESGRWSVIEEEETYLETHQA
jgi:hypothetical protein